MPQPSDKVSSVLGHCYSILSVLLEKGFATLAARRWVQNSCNASVTQLLSNVLVSGLMCNGESQAQSRVLIDGTTPVFTAHATDGGKTCRKAERDMESEIFGHQLLLLQKKQKVNKIKPRICNISCFFFCVVAEHVLLCWNLKPIWQPATCSRTCKSEGEFHTSCKVLPHKPASW